MNQDDREKARARALSTARAITLGLVIGASSGCEQLADRYCQTFDTSYCCTRSGGTWDPATSVCIPPTPVFAMPGPFVPPSEPGRARA